MLANPGVVMIFNETKEEPLKLNITKQPQQCFRFRYPPKPNESSHGVLKSDSAVSSSSPEFPTVELIVPSTIENKDFYVVITLCEATTKGAEQLNQELPPFSPHWLAKLRSKVNKTNKSNISKPVKRKLQGRCNETDKCDDSRDDDETTMAIDDKNNESNGKYEIFQKPIIEKMKSMPNGKYTFSLENYVIIRAKNELKINSLQIKHEEFNKFRLGINDLSDDLINAIKSNIKPLAVNKAEKEGERVSLGFSVYTKDTITDRYVCCLFPLLSKPIRSGDGLRIFRICNFQGNVKGGMECTLLVSEASSKGYKIFLFEKNKTSKENVWTSDAYPPEHVHRNCAITFTIPEYKGPTLDDNIKCWIQIKREKDNECSNAVGFEYCRFNYTEDIETKRRKIQIENEFTKAKENEKELKEKAGTEYMYDSCTTVKPLQKTEVSTERDVHDAINRLNRLLISDSNNTDEIFETKFEYMAQYEHGNTIFHDAVRCNEFRTLYNMIDEFKLQKYLCESSNDQKETVLHYACKLNKSENIRPLIGMGCRIYAQNRQQYTPLHLAIIKKHQECINVFENLIRNPKVYTNFESDFERLLGIYDRKGLTVLHYAVINDHRKLVEAILNFFKLKNIDENDFEVLGTGNTLLHLAIEKHLKEMIVLIYKHNPNAIYVENYAEKAIGDDIQNYLE